MLEVVFAADDNYAMPLAASVRSVLENCSDRSALRVHVLVSDVSEPRRQVLHDCWRDLTDARVEFRGVPTGVLDTLPPASSIYSYVSPTTYVRLFLSELLPTSCHKVIYLDVDTITLADLSELWTTPVDDVVLAAAVDRMIPTIGSPDGVSNWSVLDLDPLAPYFNAGVMVVNLDNWRSRGVQERCLAYLGAFPHGLTFGDQEVLNAVTGGAFCVLDPTWNVMDYWRKPERRVGRFANIVDDANILHFTGPAKPWTANCDWPAGAEQFHRYLDRSGWPERKPAR